MPIDPKKKYSVGGYSGSRHMFASTLAEAKRKGGRIARKETWRGKWNVTYMPISILISTGIGFYKPTGWKMYVPVRGTGAHADTIIAEIKRRHGVAPFKWTKK